MKRGAMTNRKLIYLLLAGSVIFMILLRIQGSALNTPVSPHGILSLEFAYHASDTTLIVAAWHDGLHSTFGWNMVLDFIFIFFYAGFFYLTCLYYSWTIPGWKKVASLMSVGALVAGGMDVLENILMIFSFNGAVASFTSHATYFLAAIKFVLVILSVIFIICASFYSGIRSLKKSTGSR